MTSRVEEKRQRREERIAREAELARAADRRRRLQLGAAILAVAAIVVAGIALSSGSSGKLQHHGSGSIAAVAIPAQQTTGLTSAAAAAGCTLLNPPSEGRTHVLTQVNYKSNPPSSGPHYPVPAHDGIYDGETPPKEQLVHALEHGRVEIQYSPATSTQVIGQLHTLINEFGTKDNDPRTLLFPNTTNMPYAIAAVAWTHILGCSHYDTKVFDAIRAFRGAYDLKAPEQSFLAAE
jgi:Protein of unknown function (DUF3105)